MTFPWLTIGVLGCSALALSLSLRLRAHAVAVVLGSGAILLLTRAYFRFTSDDAYISFRYAQNLADGHGPVWNPGERVEGYTTWSAATSCSLRVGLASRCRSPPRPGHISPPVISCEANSRRSRAWARR
jgi:hypothetical protein